MKCQMETPLLEQKFLDTHEHSCRWILGGDAAEQGKCNDNGICSDYHMYQEPEDKAKAKTYPKIPSGFKPELPGHQQ